VVIDKQLIFGYFREEIFLKVVATYLKKNAEY